MNRFFILILLMSIPGYSIAQNKVHNPGFEQMIACPLLGSYLDLQHSAEWEDGSEGSSDYFDTCDAGGPAGIPANFFGFQTPYEGGAYAGFATYTLLDPNAREYLKGNTDALSVDSSYIVTIHVNLGSHSNFASNDFGVYFYRDGFFGPTVLNLNTINVTPQIQYIITPVTDTTHWVTLTATFTADSAYTHLIIGSFKSDFEVTRIYVGPRPAGFDNAYYYCDEIEVLPNVFTVSPQHMDVSCTATANGAAGVIATGGTAPYTYHWLPGNQQLDHISGLSAGTYICRVADAAGDTLRDTIVITQLPVIIPSVSITASPGTNISPGQFVTFTAAPVNGGLLPAYNWYKNNSIISGQTDNIYTTNILQDGDIINCTLQSNDACAPPDNITTSNQLTIHISPLGIENLSGQPITIRPNPATNEVSLDNLQPNSHITIYNSIGVQQLSFTADKATAVCNISKLNTGIYIVHIVGSSGTFILRLVKD